jgi:hypothetical protein
MLTRLGPLDRRALVSGLLSLGACSAVSPPSPPAPRSISEMRFGLPDWLKPKPGQRFLTSGPEADQLRRILTTLFRVTSMPARDGTRGVVISDELTAFGYLDEHFIISKAVIDLCDNEAQLTAIVAQRLRACLNFDTSTENPTFKLPLDQHLDSELWLFAMKQGDTFALKALTLMGYDPREHLKIWRRIVTADKPAYPSFQARLREMAIGFAELGYVP